MGMEAKRKEIFEILLDNGADVNEGPPQGITFPHQVQTPLERYIYRFTPEELDEPQRIKTIELLLSKGAKIPVLKPKMKRVLGKMFALSEALALRRMMDKDERFSEDLMSTMIGFV